MSNVPSDVDNLCRRASQIPGPGHYRVRAKRNTRFANTTNMLTSTEELVRNKKFIPGPGAYGVPGESQSTP